MSKRYAIWVRELGAATERLVCEVDSNPGPIVDALYERDSVASVRVKDNAEQPAPEHS